MFSVIRILGSVGLALLLSGGVPACAQDKPAPSPADAAPVQFPAQAALSPGLRAQLEKTLVSAYDSKKGGWGQANKFIDWDNIEYCLFRAARGDYAFERMAKRTLGAGQKLIDPVWGGVYRYSTGGDWEHPHFEKPMRFQAGIMRAYALAFSQWKSEDDLEAAIDLHRYLRGFLTSPEGAFYAGQDAGPVTGERPDAYFKLDDANRRKRGIPKVDKHIYSRENGWAIQGLTALYAAVNSEQTLKDAEKAAQWVLKNRSIEGGGFRHDAQDSGEPCLADTLAMGRAFLGLYEVTANRIWLERARQAAAFIEKNFRDGRAGYRTAGSGASAAEPPAPDLDENVELARFANLLFRYTGETAFRRTAEHAMRYAASPQIARSRAASVGGILLADHELNSEPLHIAVVGSKKDPLAIDLFNTALALPRSYRRIDWWDPAEGPLPYSTIEYPRLRRAAAYLCTPEGCSSPAFNSDSLLQKLESK